MPRQTLKERQESTKARVAAASAERERRATAAMQAIEWPCVFAPATGWYSIVTIGQADPVLVPVPNN